MNSEEVHLNLHLANFLIISGILQGFILSGILFFKKSDNPLPGKLLSLTILLVNLHLTYLVILDLNIDNKYPHSLWVPYSYLTAIGPLIFLYTKSLLQKQYKVSNQEAILFLPVTIEWIVQVIQIIYSGRHNILYYNAPFDSIISFAIYVSGAVSMFYYSKRSLKIINSHEKWVEGNFSNLKNVTLSWLYKYLYYYRILWLFWVPFVIIFLVFFRLQIQVFALIFVLYTLMLGITYLTYWIGIEGLARMELLFSHANDPPSNKSNTYNNIHDHKIKSHIAKIQQLMAEDQLYLNENLSLRDLSGRLAIDPNLLSYILNTHIKKSFYEFINLYRVEDVKNKLSQAKYKNHTLLAIALECGFSSKTSFNRVFKQMTGMTPSQYQKKFKSK